MPLALLRLPQEDLVLLTRRPLPGASAVARPPAPCLLAVVAEVAVEDGGWLVTLRVGTLRDARA